MDKAGRGRSHKATSLLVDPATIGTVISIFERYATGAVSMFDLACETGIHEDAVRDMLRNSIYNGWVRREGEAAKAAPWRDDPPVSDELWEP